MSLSKAEVLYMEDGGSKRCNRCMMFIKDVSACVILTPPKVSGPDGVCGLYVHGHSVTSKDHAPMRLVSKSVAGYGESKGMGGYHCGNCGYGSGRARCAHPDLEAFPIDNFGGCCNAWVPRDAGVHARPEGLGGVPRG